MTTTPPSRLFCAILSLPCAVLGSCSRGSSSGSDAASLRSAPQITSTPTTTVVVGEPWSYTPTAAGTPTPTISMDAFPTWVSVQNGTLTGTPAASNAASHTVSISAANGVAPQAVQTFELVVSESSSRAPEFTSAPPVSAQVGVLWSYIPTVSGTPAPGLSLESAPSWLVFADGAVAGTPVEGDEGLTSVVLVASNGVSPDARHAFSLMVRDRWESNDVWQEATSITPEVEQRHVFYEAGDTDWLTFNLSAAADVSVVTNGEAGGATMLELFGPSALVSIASAGAGSGFASLPATPLQPGVYWVRITDPLGSSIAPSYTVLVSASELSWMELPSGVPNVPQPRFEHTAVWTGSEMVVWGGRSGAAAATHFDTGGVYDPVTNTWRRTSMNGAPAPRARHTAVWTGTEMLVWGGFPDTLGPSHGGRYHPASDSWLPIPSAPGALGDWHTAVWTGTEMLVFGGFGTPTGYRYNPQTNEWSTMSTNGNGGSRYAHTATWLPLTNAMLVLGGYHSSTEIAEPRLYYPATDQWVPAASYPPGYPGARWATALLIGNDVLPWGGCHPQLNQLNTGATYHPPAPDWWSRIPPAPIQARESHTAVWTGTDMIIFGGWNGSNAIADGGIYNPVTDSWVMMNAADGPSPRHNHTAVWDDAGGRMIIWGGHQTGIGALGDGGIYYPQ